MLVRPVMNSNRRFACILVGFIALYLGYGLWRLSLGVDFTDEGVYVSWPLRTLFGEAPFAGDPLLALRPMFNHLAWLHRFYPAISLYDIRLLGWVIHLGAFSALAIFLFRFSGAAWRSVLLASVPFFVCHVFGLAAPSYNSISSDFLLLALSLLGLAVVEPVRRPLALRLAAGCALFIASLAHPAIAVVAVLIGCGEAFRFLQNRRQRAPGATGGCFLTFAGCWAAYLVYLFATGAVSVWLERSALYRSARVSSLEGDSGRFFRDLLAYPFSYDAAALAFSIGAVILIVVRAVLVRRGRTAAAGNAAAALALLVILALIRTFSFNTEQLPAAFAMAAIVAGFTFILRLGPSAGPPATELRLLVAASLLLAVLYATVTFYFTPLRSWISGILPLPFAFAVGLAFLLRLPDSRTAALAGLLANTVLAFAVLCVAGEHARFIYRDAPAGRLTSTFRVPKLRHLHSTPERTQAVDALYDYLHPRLSRGEPLLAFDDCPLLYFIFDARPAYGLTWAVRYTQNPISLARFDRELNTRPLPRYAIRTLVDLSHPSWTRSPRTNYADYPLNETVVTRYTLEQTIFPFEIWRLKSSR